MISSAAVTAASHGNRRVVSVRNRVGLARSISVMASLIIAAVAAGNVGWSVSFASARVDWRQFGAQSRPWRRLAAAANGPITKLTSDSAHRIENGVPNDSGPVM